MSVLVVMCMPAGAGNMAQSSPTPSMPAGAGRAKKRAIRSNSEAKRVSSTARGGCLHLGGAHVGSQFIEHAVDELEATGAAERFGQSDRFIDGHLVRHFDVGHEFVAADKQDAVRYRRQFVQRPVDVGR